MRNSVILACIVFALLSLALFLVKEIDHKRERGGDEMTMMHQLVNELGLTDLAVSTEARYTRHPAISDVVVPFMDHPGALEHFPTGSFWRPPLAEK